MNIRLPLVLLLLVFAIPLQAAEEHVDLAKQVIKAENERLTAQIAEIEGFLARARIGDPEMLAHYHAQLDAARTAIALNAALLERGDEPLLLAAARAITCDRMREAYAEIAKTKSEAGNRIPPRLEALRGEAKQLQEQLKKLKEPAGP